MTIPYDTNEARERIADIIVRTPLLSSRWLSDHVGRPVVLKLECLQVTGSFKVRGAANKILGLEDDDARAGVIACSSGNHGLATAWVAARRAIPATICVPEWVDPIKLAAMRELGAEVVVEGATADEAEEISFRLQRERGLTYVHPFDDPEIIAGQGTVGIELLEQAPQLESVVVPVSGGGLVSGIALAVAGREPPVTVVGAYAERSPVMAMSARAGKPVRIEEEETVASALAGGIGPENRHTLELVRRHVDRMVAVPEARILDAMRGLHRHHRLVVEGGGAVAVGALLEKGASIPGAPVAAVVSGGNIDLERFLAATAGVRSERE